MPENERKLKIGFKEVLKAISCGSVKKVYIAENASESMLDKLNAAIADGGCEAIYIKSTKELGTFCKIDVGASCAAELK